MRLRLLAFAAVVAALVVGAPSVAWALWTATGSNSSSTTMGKPAGSISGTDDMTVTFSSTVRSVTKPITLTNTGNLAGTTTTSVAVVDGSSTALAAAVDVVAWPVVGAGTCTDTAAVGSGALSGTWASLPSLTSSLDLGASAVWCARSTIRADAPPSATANVRVSLTVQRAGWTSDAVTGGFYLNSPAAGS